MLLNKKTGYLAGLLFVCLLSRSGIAGGNDRYNFLWVIDNDAYSLNDQRQIMRDDFREFLDILNNKKTIQYKMAVTTTDVMSNNGDLVEASCGLKIVKSTSSDPVKDFASIVDAVKSTPTSFWEQGLEASYQAMKRNGELFMEKGVPLFIVYVSNENDFSCKGMKDGTVQCYGVEPENNPDWIPFPTDRYLNYFKHLGTSEGIDVSVFTITGTVESPCSIPSVGLRYQEIQSKIGFGVTSSICKNQFRESFEKIARVISEH